MLLQLYNLYTDVIINRKQRGSHTQIILIQLNLLHYRRHHKRERLSVEVVQCVAHKHGQKYRASVVSIAWLSHGCSLVLKHSENSSQSRDGSVLLPFATCSSELCFRIHCTQPAAYKHRSVCNQHRRLMVNFYTPKLIESWSLPRAAGQPQSRGRRSKSSVCDTNPRLWCVVSFRQKSFCFFQVLFSLCCFSI